MKLKKHQRITLTVFTVVTIASVILSTTSVLVRAKAISPHLTPTTIMSVIRNEMPEAMQPTSAKTDSNKPIKEDASSPSQKPQDLTPNETTTPETEQDVPTETPAAEMPQQEKEEDKPKKDNKEDQSIPTSTPVPTIEEPEQKRLKKQMNILLLGSDKREDGTYRTDVILLVSVNPKQNAVSIVSFPRDLYVTIPGYYADRINVAHQLGGFDLLASTFEYNFGIRPDRYVMVDFKGFTTVVDQIDGIDVKVEQTMADQCNHTLNAGSWCTVNPGIVHMNGEMALWYARARYATSDFDRTRRAQEVVEAIFDKFLTIGALTRIEYFFEAYNTYVQTNFSMMDILKLLPIAPIIKETDAIHNYVIGQDQVYDWITYEGAMVLLPDTNAIQSILREALFIE